MGQQQLLLLVLATVIVGLATVAGINAFEQNQKQATADAMTQEAMRIASDIQAYALKPEQMGGLPSGETLTDINFDDLAQYDVSGAGPYEGPNGSYQIGSSIGTASCSGDQTVYANNTDNNVSICVGITGTSSDDLTTNVDMGS
jgi:type II secretory pathway pseudopilin PulG